MIPVIVGVAPKSLACVDMRGRSMLTPNRSCNRTKQINIIWCKRRTFLFTIPVMRSKLVGKALHKFTVQLVYSNQTQLKSLKNTTHVLVKHKTVKLNMHCTGEALQMLDLSSSVSPRLLCPLFLTNFNENTHLSMKQN